MRKYRRQWQQGLGCCGAGCILLYYLPDLSLGLGLALLVMAILLGQFR